MNSVQAGEKEESLYLPENKDAQEQSQEQRKEESKPIEVLEAINLPEKSIIKENFYKDPNSFATGQLDGETTEEHFARYARDQHQNLGVPLNPSYPACSSNEPEESIIKENFYKDPNSFATGQLDGETTEEHFARYARDQHQNLGVPLNPSYPACSSNEP